MTTVAARKARRSCLVCGQRTTFIVVRVSDHDELPDWDDETCMRCGTVFVDGNVTVRSFMESEKKITTTRAREMFEAWGAG